MDLTRLQTELLLGAHGPLGWIATAAHGPLGWIATAAHGPLGWIATAAHGPLGWISTAAEAEDLGFHGLTHRTARVVASYDKHGALRTLRAYSDLISIVCDAIKKQDMMIYRSTINLS